MKERGIVIVSGGMDSVTLAYDLHQVDEITLVSIDYGQRHRKELQFAEECAKDLGADWALIDLTTLTKWLSGSSLTDPSVEVPHGHYTADSMKATVVPNRNAILLSIATGIAVARKADYVATAVHAGDHAVYPDCRSAFTDAFEHMAREGNEGFIDPQFSIYTPYIEKGKHDIASIGGEIGVPYEKTWSCYEGGEVHCGQCGTCVERKEAFTLSGIPDPTIYEVL